MFEEETEEKTNLSSAEIALQLAIDLSHNDQDGLLYYSYTLLSRGHVLQTQSVSELARENPFLIALNLADVVLNNSRFISLPESIQLKIQQAFTLYLELAITQFQSSPKIIYDTLRTEFKEKLDQLGRVRPFGDVRLEFEHNLLNQLLNLLITSTKNDLIKFVSAIKNAATGEFGAVFTYLSELYSQLYPLPLKMR